MSEIAGDRWSGMFCRHCDQEVTATDEIEVHEDGEPSADGGWHDYTTVQHAPVCPEEE